MRSIGRGLGWIAALRLLACVAPAGAETVALWLFDDPPGSAVAVDCSGHGFHLTLGPDAAIVPGGKFGNALDADASEKDGLGAFRYKAEPQLNPGDVDWTLECWLKAKPELRDDKRIWGLSGINYIDYGRGNNMVSQGVARQFGGDSARRLQVATRFLPIDGVSGWNKPTGDLTADRQYHHFAVVYDSAAKQLRHYFDGRLQFAATGTWKAVVTGEPPYRDVVFPPHFPMLQIGMRDAIQQWDHHELVTEPRHFEKFEGYVDEMRFSDAALYSENFTPPGSLARPFLRVWPEQLSFTIVRDAQEAATGAIEICSLAGRLPWTLSEEIPWLTVEASSGTAEAAPQRVVATALAAGLPDGSHRGLIRVRASGAVNDPVEVPVLLTVVPREAIRNVGNGKQLFIDRRFIERARNVRLHINAPQKVPIEFEPAYLENAAHYPSSIVYDEAAGVYRMYFWSGVTRYAESSDGIHWKSPAADRPKVVVVSSEEGGTRPLSGLVIYDPHDTPERRYKAFEERTFPEMNADGDVITAESSPSGRRALTGVYAYYSADGFRFREAGRVLPILPEIIFNAFWDDRIHKYVVYLRVQNSKAPGLRSIQGNQFFYRPGFTYERPEGFVDVVAPEAMAVEGYENLRSIGRIETDDLLKPWPVSANADRETLYTTPSQIRMVFCADKWDGFTDYYIGPTWKYPYAEDVYLMFPTSFRHFHPSRQPWFPGFADANGFLETILVVSRDGVTWDRVDRAPYVPVGRMDQPDRGRAMIGGGLVRIGNDLYQYYWANPYLHDVVPLREEYREVDPQWRKVGVAAVRQRLDGFVSADVDYRGGWLTTPPIIFSGHRLVLNHDCGGRGFIFAELQDPNGRPIPGYTLADCEEISGNDVAWEVRWRGSADLSPLVGRPVMLHLKMVSAKLYAFQFCDA